MRIINRVYRLVVSVAALAAVAALCITPSMAAGSDPGSHEGSRTALIEHLEASGVPDLKQESLADKIEAGEVLEADMKASKPIQESTVIKDGFTVVRKDYSDGSFVESVVEIGEPASAPGTVSPYAISGCSSTGGTGYRQMSNCLVQVNSATYSANFRATWVHAQNGVGTISSVWDSSVQVYYGTFSNKSLSIIRKTSSGSTPAQARLKWRYTALGGVAQGDSAIYLNVTGANAWTSAN